jgi:simple sugar transport system substrate-binding protein
MKINGETIGEGTNLGLTGYESLKANGNVLYGQAWVDVTKDNAADYPF